VIGKPDPLRTEIVKAFVVVRDDYAATGDKGDTASNM
jgi:acyl-coenzyme A synthetase/AMP-(fatty) acid ligase